MPEYTASATKNSALVGSSLTIVFSWWFLLLLVVVGWYVCVFVCCRIVNFTKQRILISHATYMS